MSDEKSTEALQEMLGTLYGNIVHYAKEDMLQTAEKNFYSTRDYALGDTVSCSADAALENCEQIRGCFPLDVPRSALENIDQVKNEIHRLEQLNRPGFLKTFWIPILVAVIIGIGWLISHFESRY